MFLMLLWGLPVLLPLSFLNTDTAGVTRATQLCVVLRFCGLGTSNAGFTLFSKVSWSSCSDHPFFQLFPAKDATTAGAVRTA